MTHYETLGVAPDASTDEIKRAYRRRAAETHPDKVGGDASGFAPVAKAWEVLKDPERRLLYDTTGDSEQQKPVEIEARSILLEHFSRALASGENIPLVDTVRKFLRQGMGGIPAEQKKLRDQSKRLKARRKTVRAKGDNLIHFIIDGQLRNITGQLANLDHQKDVGEACLALLETYEEDWTEPEPEPIRGTWVIGSPGYGFDSSGMGRL